MVNFYSNLSQLAYTLLSIRMFPWIRRIFSGNLHFSFTKFIHEFGERKNSHAKIFGFAYELVHSDISYAHEYIRMRKSGMNCQFTFHLRHNIPSENDQCPCPIGLGYLYYRRSYWLRVKSKVSNIQLEINSICYYAIAFHYLLRQTNILSCFIFITRWIV